MRSAEEGVAESGLITGTDLQRGSGARWSVEWYRRIYAYGYAYIHMPICEYMYMWMLYVCVWIGPYMCVVSYGETSCIAYVRMCVCVCICVCVSVLFCVDFLSLLPCRYVLLVPFWLVSQFTVCVDSPYVCDVVWAAIRVYVEKHICRKCGLKRSHFDLWTRLKCNVLLCYLVDPASSHMLVSKIKPCMSKNKPSNGESANGSLNQLLSIWWYLLKSGSGLSGLEAAMSLILPGSYVKSYMDNRSNSRANTCADP